MGKNRKQEQNQSNASANRAIDSQTRLAEKLVNQSDPLREQLFQQSGDFLSGDFDVSSLPQFAGIKNNIEQQFGRAQDNIIASTPEGGGLTEALVGANVGRAGATANAIGALGDAEINRALQLATFGAAQGNSGFGQAGSTAAGLAQAESQRNAGKNSGLGSAAGGIAGSMISKGA